jgi:hypothetical protein
MKKSYLEINVSEKKGNIHEETGEMPIKADLSNLESVSHFLPQNSVCVVVSFESSHLIRGHPTPVNIFAVGETTCYQGSFTVPKSRTNSRQRTVLYRAMITWSSHLK